MGVIAHELQENYPLLVHGEKDGEDLQCVNYMGLIPILVNEIQNIKKTKLTYTNIDQNTNEFVFDYTKKSTFYINAPPTNNITANFINVPVQNDQIYSLTIIINSLANKVYVNKITVNGNSCKFYIEGGFNNVNVSDSSIVLQKFNFVNNMNGTPDFTLSEILNYN